MNFNSKDEDLLEALIMMVTSYCDTLTTKQRRKKNRQSINEVREWYNATHTTKASIYSPHQATNNNIVPTRKGYINKLAEEIYHTVRQYDIKLPNNKVRKPTTFKKAAANLPEILCFQVEAKERDGMLKFKPVIIHVINSII